MGKPDKVDVNYVVYSYIMKNLRTFSQDMMLVNVQNITTVCSYLLRISE